MQLAAQDMACLLAHICMPACSGPACCGLLRALPPMPPAADHAPPTAPPQPALLPKTGRVKRHAHEDHQLAPGPKLEAQRHGTAAITVDLDKCIQCGRCVTMCQDVQNMNVLGWVGRGKERHVGVVMDQELAGSRWG